MEQSFISGILGVWHIKEKSRLSIYQTSGFMVRLGEEKNIALNCSLLITCFKILSSKTGLRSSVCGDKELQ